MALQKDWQLKGNWDESYLNVYKTIKSTSGKENSQEYKNIDILLQLVQLLRRIRLSATPWTEAHQAALSLIISQSLLQLMSIAVMMPSNHLTLCRPVLLLPSTRTLWRFLNKWKTELPCNPANLTPGIYLEKQKL